MPFWPPRSTSLPIPSTRWGSGAGRRSQSLPSLPPLQFRGLIESRYIRQAAQRLRDDFDSDVPKTVDELCSLPGVGPKMAFLCLHAAWDMSVSHGLYGLGWSLIVVASSRTETWVLVWMFMCTVSPTGSSGTNHLRKARKRPGEMTGWQVLLAFSH